MGRRIISIIVFVLSLISLLISLRLFYNLGVFVDEYNLNFAIVNGGYFWLLMDWLRLFLLFLLCMVSGISIFIGKRKK